MVTRGGRPGDAGDRKQDDGGDARRQGRSLSVVGGASMRAGLEAHAPPRACVRIRADRPGRALAAV